MSLTIEEQKEKQLIGVNVPAVSADDKPVFIQPADIIGADRMNVYDYFLDGVLDSKRKIKRECLLSAIGDYEKTLFAGEVLTSVLNSVCTESKEAGLYVPAYNGLPAIIRFNIPAEKQSAYQEYQKIEEDNTLTIIVKGEDKQLKKLVFSKLICLKDGVLNRLDNFTGEDKYRFAAKVFGIFSPDRIITAVRRAEADKQNIITAALKAAIMSYVPESLSIRAVELMLVKEWETMDTHLKDLLLEQYAKDVFKTFKKEDKIRSAESKSIGSIVSVLREKIQAAYVLMQAANNPQN